MSGELMIEDSDEYICYGCKNEIVFETDPPGFMVPACAVMCGHHHGPECMEEVILICYECTTVVPWSALKTREELH